MAFVGHRLKHILLWFLLQCRLCEF